MAADSAVNAVARLRDLDLERVDHRFKGLPRTRKA